MPKITRHGGTPSDTSVSRPSGDGVSRPTAAAVSGNQAVSGNETVGGTLGVTGAATLLSTLDVTSTLTALGYLGVGSNAGITGVLDVSGNALGDWHPRDAGLVGWSCDPALVSGTLQITGGTIYLTKIPICRAATPTKLYWYVTTGATTATPSENWVSVLSSAGAVLATPVDVATASETSGLKTTTVAPGALAAGSFVWGALLLQADTEATLAVAPASALTTLTTLGTATAALRHATNGTSQTTITTRTPASNSAGPAIWMGLGT